MIRIHPTESKTPFAKSELEFITHKKNKFIPIEMNLEWALFALEGEFGLDKVTHGYPADEWWSEANMFKFNFNIESDKAEK